MWIAHVSGLADLLAQYDLWKSGNKLTTVLWHHLALWTKNHNCYNKEREKERLGERVKDNKKRGREKREKRVGTAKDQESIPVEWERKGEISVWERETESETIGPQTEGETHALARIQTPTGKLMAACQQHEWTHLPLALSLSFLSFSLFQSQHSLIPNSLFSLSRSGWILYDRTPFFSLHLALALHLSSYLFPPLVLLINTQLERTGKNQC